MSKALHTISFGKRGQ